MKLYNSDIDIEFGEHRNILRQIESRESPCYQATIYRGNNWDTIKPSIRLAFEMSGSQAALLAKALRHVRHTMDSDGNNKFGINIEGAGNISTGLQAIFKCMKDGTILNKSSELPNNVAPMVSTDMQAAITGEFSSFLMNAPHYRIQPGQRPPEEITYD